jgi:hypothetical protein
MLIFKPCYSWGIPEFQNFTVITFVTDSSVRPELRATLEGMAFSANSTAIITAQLTIQWLCSYPSKQPTTHANHTGMC